MSTTLRGIFGALDDYIHEDASKTIATDGGTARCLGDSPLYAHCAWIGDWVIFINYGGPSGPPIAVVTADDRVSDPDQL